MADLISASISKILLIIEDGCVKPESDSNLLRTALRLPIKGNAKKKDIFIIDLWLRDLQLHKLSYKTVQ
jgi:hypothetical protein